MKTDIEKIILTKIMRNKKPLPFKNLLNEMRGKKFDFDRFTNAVEKLKREGKIIETSKGLSIPDRSRYIKGEVIRLSKTFGFVKDLKSGEEYFIPGKFLKGAMPKDIVLIRPIKARGDSPEGEVMEISEENFAQFTGVIVKEHYSYKILPDTMAKTPIEFENPYGLELHEGDKVIAEITVRGNRHSEHRCEIVSTLGSSQKASVCALSVLEINNITPVFPDEVIAQAREVSDYTRIKAEAENRLDLRGEVIFTIDGADTKDIDDAVSVEKTQKGYRLGVHIADVSHYVTPKSPLDNEAFRRGTSVYYANRVIPMLPKELSNGICSLNPQEDRLAFSCLMDLDSDGNLAGYRFAKTIIRSRVKGVYSEINRIIAGEVSEELSEKYSEVMDRIPVMVELADKLYRNRIARGAPQLESAEGCLLIDENDTCVDVVLRKRGASEELIEDFMLMANQSAAKFGVENGLPFVYRIHEDPPEDKADSLVEGLALLNIPFAINGRLSPKIMSEILEKTHGTDKQTVVNNLVLRSMAKAKYSVEPVGHFGLVLEDYAHFTSPIRRYPDLAIHRIMSEFLKNGSASECMKKYNKFSYAAADQSTNTELLAMQVERECEDCYKAEYMKKFVGESFDGIIVSVTDFGFFVELPNTCEGLVRIEELSEGEYSFDGYASLKNMNTGESYRIGDSIKVKVLDANVSSGKVDFALFRN